MSDFFTVHEKKTYEVKIKGSKFIGQILPINNTDHAESELNEIKKQYHDATHNCYAYRAGDKDNISYRFSDDGEPGGTAGKPILSVIEGNRLNNVLIVVTRYFGGTKLGTGGLTRAYSLCASEVVKKSNIHKIVVYKKIKVKIPHTFVNSFYKIVEDLKVKILDTQYSDVISADLMIEEEKVDKFINIISETSAGKAELMF